MRDVFIGLATVESTLITFPVTCYYLRSLVAVLIALFNSVALVQLIQFSFTSSGKAMSHLLLKKILLGSALGE